MVRKPDVAAADGVTTDVEGLHPFAGTSAAAPQVAGIAALMWSKDRSLTAEQIKEALRMSAIPIETPEEWNPLSGYGVVNAVRALRAIKERQASSPDSAADRSKPCKEKEGAGQPKEKQDLPPLK